ncbi:MAG: hypothetical protein AAFR53_16760 [Pseudomonadota bacterium]
MFDLFEFDPFSPSQATAEKPPAVPNCYIAVPAETLQTHPKGSLLAALKDDDAPLGSLMSHMSRPSLVAQFMSLDPIAKEAFEERAAILEYESGLSRPKAEAKAMRMVCQAFASQT